MRTDAVGIDELRDIHLPPDLPWFQPAPAWWLLLLSCLVVIAVALVKWWQRRRAADPVLQARLQLEAGLKRWRNDGNKPAYLHHAATTLKVLALRRRKRSRIARLTGDDWIHWLNTLGSSEPGQAKSKSQSNDQPLGPSSEQALTTDLYQRNPQTDIEQLHRDLNTWLQRNGKPSHA